MNEQRDIAVDLEVIPEPLPRVVSFGELEDSSVRPPPLIIDGVLHQGCKLVLGGTSKSNKSWCLLDMAVSVATGQKWWGRSCAKAPVLYVNFELPEWALRERIISILAARPECIGVRENLHVWNLRGHNADFAILRPQLMSELEQHEWGLIVIDPAYKVLGARDENSNGDIASLMNEFERLAQSTRAAVVIAHHFAKGDSTAKEARDRMSGAGTWARDPDSLLVLTPHEQEGCFTVTSILRNLPVLPEFVVEWDFPLLRVAADLDPDALRRPQAKNKVCTDREFMERFLDETPKSRGAIVQRAEEMGVSASTSDRYLRRLSEACLIGCGGGLYWRLGR